MNSTFPNLLQPARFNDLNLSNRVWMAPMTRSRASVSGTPGQHTALYYAQRATAGMIVSEAINISKDAVGSPLTPGLFTDEHVQAWRYVTQAVHNAGGKIIAQLWHTGRVGHSIVRGGILPLAPSAIAIQGQKHYTPEGLMEYETPRAMSLEDIRKTLIDYEKAAKRAKAAGFDGVELHAAFGYLPNQFLVDGANKRDDQYGGGRQNRVRFVIETVERLTSVWDSGRVGIKLSPSIPFNNTVDSDPTALYTHLIKELELFRLGYLHLMQPLFPLTDYPHWPKDVLSTFAKFTSSLVVVNGGYDPASAENEIATSRANFVSFGTPFIANPDFVHRISNGFAISHPDRSTMYGGDERGYIDYPPAIAGS